MIYPAAEVGSVADGHRLREIGAAGVLVLYYRPLVVGVLFRSLLYFVDKAL